MSLGEAPKRTIDEFATLLHVEPSQRILIVEGPSDLFFMEHVCKVQNLVVDIFVAGQYLEIDSTTVTGYGLDVGERGRVLASALEVAEKTDTYPDNVIFVVDRDFSSIWPDPITPPSAVAFTDYASLEMYGFDEKTMRKLLDLVLRVTYTGDILDQITGVLMDLFLLRGHFRSCGCSRSLPAKLGKHLNSCSTTGRLAVDLEKMALSATTTHSQKCETCRPDNIRRLVVGLRTECTDRDPRLFVRAHDVPIVLMSLLDGSLPAALKSPEVLERAWVGCFDVDEIVKEGLFRRIVAFAS